MFSQVFHNEPRDILSKKSGLINRCFGLIHQKKGEIMPVCLDIRAFFVYNVT